MKTKLLVSGSLIKIRMDDKEEYMINEMIRLLKEGYRDTVIRIDQDEEGIPRLRLY